MFNQFKQFWWKEEKEDKKNLVVHEVKPNRDKNDEKKNKSKHGYLKINLFILCNLKFQVTNKAIKFFSSLAME